MKALHYLGAAIGLTSMVLGCLWFGWELSLVIFLALLGDNMSKKKQTIK
jgi:purine-cytosine permease-like protein